jgi:hypothetical protein
LAGKAGAAGANTAAEVSRGTCGSGLALRRRIIAPPPLRPAGPPLLPPLRRLRPASPWRRRRERERERERPRACRRLREREGHDEDESERLERLRRLGRLRRRGERRRERLRLRERR